MCRQEARALSLSPLIRNEAEVELEAWDDPVKGRVTWRTLVSGDRTPSSGLTQGVADVEATEDGAPRVHRHRQAETYYILSGRGVMRIAGVDYPLSPGDVVFIPGGVWHGACAVGDAPLRLLYTFAADSFTDVVYEFPES